MDGWMNVWQTDILTEMYPLYVSIHLGHLKMTLKISISFFLCVCVCLPSFPISVMYIKIREYSPSMKLVSYCVHYSAPVGRPRGRPPNLNDSVCDGGICCFFVRVWPNLSYWSEIAKTKSNISSFHIDIGAAKRYGISFFQLVR